MNEHAQDPASTPKKPAGPGRLAVRIALSLIGSVAVIVAIYVAYVMVTYYRLDDALPLPVDAALDGSTTPTLSADVFDGEELTVVTANLGFGAYTPEFDFFMDGGTGSVAKSAQSVTQSIQGSAAAIAAEDPDFVFCQEVDINGTRSHHVDEYALLRQAWPQDVAVFAQNYDSPFLAWPPTQPHGANQAGMATFSRFALEDGMRHSLPVSEGFSKFLDLDRCFSVVRTPLENGRSLVLINVHLSAYGADASVMEAQRSALYSVMKAERDAGNYVVAGGDYNHDMLGNSSQVFGNKTQVEASWAKPFDFTGVPEGFTVAAKAQAEADEQAAVKEGEMEPMAATCRDAGRAWDGTNDRWVMDTFIYSDNIERISCQTLDLEFAYSDHNPVILRFKLK